jgi:hypothetical protein
MSSSKKFTCTGTLRQVFIRVHKLEIQSVMFVIFGLAFVNYCPLTFSLVPLSPHLPPFLCQSTVYMYRECVTGRGWGCWVLLKTIFCSSFTLCIWPDSEPTKLLHQPHNFRQLVCQFIKILSFLRSLRKKMFWREICISVTTTRIFWHYGG